MTGKPAILIVYKGKDIAGVYVFDSHLDGMDAVERYEQLGYHRSTAYGGADEATGARGESKSTGHD